MLEATAGIHYGATATYCAVATKAGSPRAVRAAGSALGSNPTPVIVPCHRVVRSDGGLGGYRGGLGRKATLLRHEAGEQAGPFLDLTFGSAIGGGSTRWSWSRCGPRRQAALAGTPR